MALAQDADDVLSKCRKLRQELKTRSIQQRGVPIINLNNAKEMNVNSIVLDDEQGSFPGVVLKMEPGETSVANVALHNNIASLQGKSIIEVSEMSPMEVVEAIESIAIQIANQVLQKKGFTLEIPSRSSSNQIYVPELDRIVLGEKRGTRSFLNVKVSDD